MSRTRAPRHPNGRRWLIVTMFPAILLVVMGTAATTASAEPAQNLLRNGSFEDGMTGWFESHRQADTTASVVDVDGDGRLEVSVAAAEGAVAQDLAVTAEAGRTYSASIRAVSVTGFPVTVELAVHAMTEDGSIAESGRRTVEVEGYEVPITAILQPEADHPSIRVEVYVHTVDQPVQLDDARFLIDGDHHGPENYGYQRARVRYLDDVNLADLLPGRRYRVEVSVESTTDQPWRCCGVTDPVRLGTEDADLIGGSERHSTLHVPAEVDGSGWLTPNRVAFDHQESTTGGTFTTLIQAPSDPGPFAERFRLVAEGTAWMPGPVIEVIGNVLEVPDVVPGPDRPPIDGGFCDEEPPEVEPLHPGSRCDLRQRDFTVKLVEARPGRMVLHWNRPHWVRHSHSPHYVVSVLDADKRVNRTQVTPHTTHTMRVPPGRYQVEVQTVGGGPLWSRSHRLVVEVPPPVSPPPPTCWPAEINFERPVLLGYDGLDKTDVTDVELPCGRYEVHLLSGDDRHRLGYQSEQDGERWVLEGLDRHGEVIYTSPPSDDLPESQPANVTVVGVADVEGVVGFRARHLRGGTSADSVSTAAVLFPVLFPVSSP